MLRSILGNPSAPRHCSIAFPPGHRASARAHRRRAGLGPGDYRAGRTDSPAPTIGRGTISARHALEYGGAVRCRDGDGVAIETNRTLHSEHGAIVTVCRVLLLQSYSSFTLHNIRVDGFSLGFFSATRDTERDILDKLSIVQIR